MMILALQNDLKPIIGAGHRAHRKDALIALQSSITLLTLYLQGAHRHGKYHYSQP